MNQKLHDENGLPTKEALDMITSCPVTGSSTLFPFMVIAWDTKHGGLISRLHPHLITFHTGGWEGNERIIEALKSNTDVWGYTWYRTTHGGIYEFCVGLTREQMTQELYHPAPFNPPNPIPRLIKTKWESWFAWYPVKLQPGEGWAWLKTIQRRVT